MWGKYWKQFSSNIQTTYLLSTLGQVHKIVNLASLEPGLHLGYVRPETIPGKFLVTLDVKGYDETFLWTCPVLSASDSLGVTMLTYHWQTVTLGLILGRVGRRASKLMAWIWIVDSSLGRNSSSLQTHHTLSITDTHSKFCWYGDAVGFLYHTSNPCKMIKSSARSHTSSETQSLSVDTFISIP